MGEMLLEGGYGVGGIYLANKSVLSMYGGGRTTGVCVDSGEDMTYIVPCWEGTPLPDATLILRLGGKQVTDRLLHLLSNGKYSFSDDTFLLWKRGGRSKAGSRLTVASRRDVVREAKERFCRVSPVALAKAAAGSICKDEEEEVLRLPDGNIVVVGEEAYSAPELMFCPEMGNKKSSPTAAPPAKTGGLAELVYQSVMRCEERRRPRLLSNIMLTGGNSLLPGLNQRLQSELRAMLQKAAGGAKKAAVVRVQAQEGRENFTWDGGAHLCSLSSFQRLWLTKQDYMETGATLNVQTGKMYGEEVLQQGVKSC